MSNTIALSVIIPAYNEQQRIGPTLEALDDYLAAGALDYEIVVVDDGSTDGTVDLVRSLGDERPAISCIEAKPNRGKGSAVRIGMLAARGAVRVMYDADGAIGANQLPKIVEPVRRGEVAIAIGSRYVDGATVDHPQPRYRVAWSRLANAVVQWTLVPGVRDTQCGFKAFSAAAARRLFERGRIDGWAFDLEILALGRTLGFAIREVAVAWSDDPRSRINPVRDAIAVIGEMLTIRRNLRAGVYDRVGLLGRRLSPRRAGVH